MNNHTAVIGFPVDHSISPSIHNFWIQEEGLKVGNYQKISLKQEEVKSFFEKCLNENYRGLNVTVPYKEIAFELCHSTSQTATKLRAVNTIIFENNKIIGDNTDPIGFKNSLSNKNKVQYVEDKKVLVLGAGGSARSIIYQLNLMGANIINSNRTEEKSSKIKKDLNISLEFCDIMDLPSILGELDCIINTTSLGIGGKDNDLIDFNLLKDNSYVYDLLYNPKKTKFLINAEKEGHNIQNGLRMLIFQAAASFEIWHGVAPKINDKLIESLE